VVTINPPELYVAEELLVTETGEKISELLVVFAEMDARQEQADEMLAGESLHALINSGRPVVAV